jgi:hypothetical protein
MNSFSALLVASAFSLAALLLSACGVQDDEPAPPEPYIIEAPGEGSDAALACRSAIVDRIVLDRLTWMCRCPLVAGDGGCSYECNDCSLQPGL